MSTVKMRRKRTSNIMNTLTTIALVLFKILLILLAGTFAVFFLATGHSFNFSDSGQLTLFSFLLVFIFSFVLLLLLKRKKVYDSQVGIYRLNLLFLFGTLGGLVYLLNALSSVNYGDTKPYFLFIAVGLGFALNFFLLYIFLLGKRFLFIR
jgi:hypothetical protein